MSNLSIGKPRQRQLPAALKKSAVAIAAGMAVGLAIAAAPPADTTIGNVATASYLDTSGATQRADSNLVETKVEQVGAFALDSDNRKFAAAGNRVSMPHTLTNLGNGADNFRISVIDTDGAAPAFSAIEIYPDVDGDGQADAGSTALCSTITATPACSAGFLRNVPGSSGTFKFVAVYTVPNSVTPATWPTNQATVTAVVDPASPVLATYPVSTHTDTDIVDLTTVAAFSMNKSIAAPASGITLPGGAAWPSAPTFGPVSSSPSCPTTWSAGLNSTATCTYTIYTLRYTNSGGAVGAMSIRDVLPAGLSYVNGSAIWSSQSGIALGELTGNADDPAGITFESVSGTIKATIASVNPNSSGTLSFIALVNPTAAVGGSSTTNVANYSSLACTDPDTCTTTPTNGSPFTVMPTYGVVAANATSTVPDDVEDNPTQGGIDLVVQPSVAAGASVSFEDWITNTGNATDTFNISFSNSTFPAGTSITFLTAAGTALIDTNDDGLIDTGPMAVGSSIRIIKRIQIPASAAVGSGPFNVLVTAKSGNDASTSARNDDSVWNRVNTVVGSLVDITNTASGTGSGAVAGGDLGPGPSPQPTTTNVTPAGTGTTFSLFIKNNDSIANSFSLAASQTPTFPGTLPAGWVVSFHAAGGTCASPTITATGSIAGGAPPMEVVACVTPPATATPGTQNVYFQARSTANASIGVVVMDTKLDAVTVTARASAALSIDPDRSGQIAASGTVVYGHTIRNIGNQNCGPVSLGVVLSPATLSAGWTYTLYIDGDGDAEIDGEPTDVLITTSTLFPTTPDTVLEQDETVRVLVKLFAPGDAQTGTQITATVTVTDSTGVCSSDNAIDQTSVVTGQLRLIKWQAADLNCDGTEVPTIPAELLLAPGQCIVYRVIAANEGEGLVRNVQLIDAVPAYTTYGAVQPPLQCTATGLSTGAVSLSTAGAPVVSVNCGSLSNTLNPAGRVELRFSVRINPLP